MTAPRRVRASNRAFGRRRAWYSTALIQALAKLPEVHGAFPIDIRSIPTGSAPDVSADAVRPPPEAAKSLSAQVSAVRAIPGCAVPTSRDAEAAAPERPPHLQLLRSEERRDGKECVRKCRSRWSPYP